MTTSPVEVNPDPGGRRGPSAATAFAGLLPIALLLLTLLLLRLLLPTDQAVYEFPLLLLVLNTLFVFVGACGVAFIAGRSYLLTGSPTLLLMGCGVLALGLGTLLAGWLMGPGGPNAAVTVHNLAALLAATLHAVGLWRGWAPAREKTRGPRLVGGVAGLVLMNALLALGAMQGLLPRFFVQGVGPTPVRQAVLLAALVLFGFACALLARRYRETRARFLFWYACALGLLAVNLLGVFLQPAVGSLIGWVARAALYLAGFYFLLAVVAASREAKAHGVELDRALAGIFLGSDGYWQDLLATVGEAIISCDTEGRILQWNQAAERIFGYSRAEALGQRLHLVWPDERAAAAALTMGSGVLEAELTRREGAPFTGEMAVSTRDLWLGRVTTLVVRDITDRRRAEQERELTAEFLQLVRQSAGRRDLIQATVSFFLRHSGCDAVGLRLKKGDDYPYFEVRGFGEEFVVAENSLCAKDASGRICCDEQGHPILECMCGCVLEGRFDPAQPIFTFGGSFWTNSTTDLLAASTEADRGATTRNHCNREGYESVALIPLRAGEERLGLLQINDRRRGRFTPELIAHWERLTGYVAVAVAKLEAEEARQAGEERYHVLYETMLQGVVHQDVDGQIISMNPAAERILGKTREEFLGQTSVDTEHDTIREDGTPFPGLEHPAMVALRTGQAVMGVVMGAYNPRAREYRWITISAVPLFRPGEVTPYQVYTIFDDITARRVTEQALRTSEERYHALFNGMTEGFALHEIICDEMGEPQDYRFLDVNPAFERLTGLRREQVVGHTYKEVLPNDDPYWLEAYASVAITGEPLQFENYSPMLGQHYEVFAYRPAPRQFAVVFMDITARKLAEEEALRQRGLWETMLEGVPTLVAYLDRELRFVGLNSQYARTSGVRVEELVGRSYEELFPERADLAATLRHVLDTGETMIVAEYHGAPIRRPEYGARYWDMVFTPVRNGDGAVEGVVKFIQDVTDRVAQRERLLAAQRSRAELAEHLNQEINHRVKNHLAMAAGLLQMQMVQQDPETVAVLRDSVARLHAFASLYEQLQITHTEEVELLDAVRRIAAATCRAHSAGDVEVAVEGEPVVCPAGVATNLAVTVNELITNALKHGAADADGRRRVKIVVGGEAQGLHVTVWNSGRPVAEGFDPSLQGGLGLRLVWSLVVEGYGGTFSIASEEGGTRSCITLPMGR